MLILFGRRIGRASGLVAVAASTAAGVIALPLAWRVLNAPEAATLTWSFEWLRWGEQAMRMGVLVDPPAALLLFVVTVTGTLIQVYSTGYMAGHPRYSRFFAYVSLFMAGMLGLVVADNLLLLFVSWEIMGLCSYFLIGFFFEKPSAAAAGLKAFITTRIGDVGLMLGMILLWWTAGTLRFEELAAFMAGHPVATGALTAAALLIFVGTIGKSAQFPLHVWLPDAMEGPTPVSALIHAATMVAAGVYLVARTFMLFQALPVACSAVAWVGGITALMAACIAPAQTDIKRVLAYSTISQLGYMVMALGVGAYAAGLFHLMTHAFFKALLFLGAGAVIHGFHHVQDMRQMGGLRRKMPVTFATMAIATFAIAGVPPLAGFWSKDEILLSAYHASRPLWVLGTVTAGLTAFYMFRLLLMTFFGEQRDKHIHAHESPAVMTIPLVILAVFAALAGLPGSPWMGMWLQRALHVPWLHPHEVEPSRFVMGLSVLVAGAGIGAAALMYGPRPVISPARLAERFAPVHRASLNKFYFDELYLAAVVNPAKRLAAALWRTDQRLVDGAVNGAGLSAWLSAKAQGFFDKWVVDGLVNLAGAIVHAASAVTRRAQTGLVENYMLMAAAGVLALAYFTWWNTG